MDIAVKHWAPFPRPFPGHFPLESCGFVRKHDCVRWTFDSCTFSLILKGSGSYLHRGRLWDVQTPCVITQWPGEYVEYGPAPGQSWEEIYFIYPSALKTRFEQAGLIEDQLPVWPIENPAIVQILANELQQLIDAPMPDTVVDRVDRICERIILETRLRLTLAEKDPLEAIQARMRQQLALPFELKEWANRLGMSDSTFRRRWAERVKTPPAQFLQQLRLNEACRLLAETEAPVYEIAHRAGYEDEL